MVTVSPLRAGPHLARAGGGQADDVWAERILAVMRRRQADARTELLFSAELLTRFVGAKPAGVFRASESLSAIV
jgi:hypothetical protein